MIIVKQQALVLQPKSRSKLIKADLRAELVKLFADLLIQILKSNEKNKEGGAIWKR